MTKLHGGGIDEDAENRRLGTPKRGSVFSLFNHCVVGEQEGDWRCFLSESLAILRQRRTDGDPCERRTDVTMMKERHQNFLPFRRNSKTNSSQASRCSCQSGLTTTSFLCVWVDQNRHKG